MKHWQDVDQQVRMPTGRWTLSDNSIPALGWLRELGVDFEHEPAQVDEVHTAANVTYRVVTRPAYLHLYTYTEEQAVLLKLRFGAELFNVYLDLNLAARFGEINIDV